MIERISESKTFYIILSVLVAIIFWFYVRTVEDPVKSTVIRNVPVEVTGETILANQGLAVAELSQTSVDFRVEAPTSVLDTLNRKNVVAIVDVSKCVAGENSLTYSPRVQSNISTEGATWLGQSPETITVRVEKLDSKVFPIEFQLRGSVAEGYQAGTAAISPETVTVSGPVEYVSKVAKVAAVLEVNGLSEPYTGNLPLVLLDANGGVLEDMDVEMDAESAYVSLPVVVVREIDLKVNLIPGGGAAVSDADWKIEPETITVSGPVAAMEGLTELSLGSVDLSKVIGTKMLSMPITLSPTLENVSGVSNATVTVTVDGLSTRSFEVDNITPVNKPAGYEVSVVTQVRSIVVRGNEEDLAMIDASQIRIVADLGGEITTVGTYPVPVSVYLDSNDAVGVVGEYSIVVNISR